MYRFQQMTNKLTRQLTTFANAMPRLGSDFAFDQGSIASCDVSPAQTGRNRWARNDLASAIGQDPHDGDAQVSVWPPASVRS